MKRTLSLLGCIVAALKFVHAKISHTPFDGWLFFSVYPKRSTLADDKNHNRTLFSTAANPPKTLPKGLIRINTNMRRKLPMEVVAN